jgi:hypothetical protein
VEEKTGGGSGVFAYAGFECPGDFVPGEEEPIGDDDREDRQIANTEDRGQEYELDRACRAERGAANVLVNAWR